MDKRILFALIVFFIILPYGAGAAKYDAVIVRADFPVDVAVAQTYTQQSKIPLITAGRTGIDQETEYELYGYGMQGYKNILIIGGESAVPQSVESDLTRLNFTVERLWDWDRYGTAARVAVSLWEKSDAVVVLPGDQTGILFSAERTAMDFNCPLLLVETNRVPDETKQAIAEIGASRIILVGNVSESVKAELSELGGLQPTQQTQITIAKQTSGTKGLFLIGILIGGLVIFLISSLFSVGIFGQKGEVPTEILSGDEKKIIRAIEKHKNALKQEELSKLTGFSRQKITRLTFELEERDIIEKKREGKTFVLILKRPIR